MNNFLLRKHIFHNYKYLKLNENSFQTTKRHCSCGRVEIYDTYLGGTWFRIDE